MGAVQHTCCQANMPEHVKEPKKLWRGCKFVASNCCCSTALEGGAPGAHQSSQQYRLHRSRCKDIPSKAHVQMHGTWGELGPIIAGCLHSSLFSTYAIDGAHTVLCRQRMLRQLDGCVCCHCCCKQCCRTAARQLSWTCCARCAATPPEGLRGRSTTLR